MTVEKPESMIFDLDGTLFKTETLLLPAFHVSLTQMIQETGYEGPVPEDREVLGTLGMLMDEIWKRLLPGCTPEQIDRMNELLAYHELSGLESGEESLLSSKRYTAPASTGLNPKSIWLSYCLRRIMSRMLLW